MKRSKISEFTLLQLKEKQNFKCNDCGTPLEKNKFHLDHIKPLSKGGKDIFDNCQLLCLKCHSRKNKQEKIGFTYTEDLESEICKHCGKVVEGHTKNQVEYLIKQHIVSKHPEKIKFEEEENDE